jgi:hypothetical protein
LFFFDQILNLVSCRFIDGNYYLENDFEVVF